MSDLSMTALPPARQRSRDRRMRGFRRADGRLGIRNYVLVVYLVECAHHVARRIAEPFQEQRRAAHRLSRLLSERLRAPHPRGDVHASELAFGAARLARLRGVPPQRAARGDPRKRAAGRASGHPAGGRHGRHDRRRAAPGSRRGSPKRRRRRPSRSSSPTSSSAPSAAARTAVAASPPTRPSAAPSTAWSMPAQR